MTRDEKWLLEEKYNGQETGEYEADKERLASGEPLSYVIGWQPFLGLKIYLDSKPLIPRPETEWWVEQLLEKSKDAQACSFEEVPQRDGARRSKFPAGNYASPKTNMPARLKLLDLCAGSGAIGCAALARLPGAEVYFGEIDPVHEATIQRNIRVNGLDESRAHVCIGDLFEPFGDQQFDLIAVNPPYVPSGRTLPASVTAYEPAQALYAGMDGLDFLRRIADGLPTHLAPQGVAWIEIDSEHAGTARMLFARQDLAAEIRNDQYGKPRIIVVSFR